MSGDHTEFTREATEAALAHVIGDKAEAAYRRSDALDKRRKLMDSWAAFCEPASEPADARQTCWSNTSRGPRLTDDEPEPSEARAVTSLARHSSSSCNLPRSLRRSLYNCTRRSRPTTSRRRSHRNWRTLCTLCIRLRTLWRRCQRL